MPQAAPTTTFSTHCPAIASSTPSKEAPHAADAAFSTATSSAAEELTPLFGGRSDAIKTLIPPLSAHPWNFFLPRPGIGAGVRLIDWEDWGIDTATDDLAYMMAMLWYPDRRDRMERPLLDLYHAALLAHGVSGYDRQALHDDYRLSVLWLITRPIGQAANNIPARVWWNNLERIMLAVDDLGCRDLLS